METLTKINSKINPIRNEKVNVMDFISLLSIVLLIGVFTAINHSFIGVSNIRNLLTDIAPILLVGIGITFVLLIGSIDLSIGSICSCSAVILAILIPKVGNAAYLIALLFGFAAGLINGVVYTKVKIPSFIATLGFMSIWQSVAYLISGGAPLLIPMQEWNHVAWAKVRFGIFSLPLIIALGVLLIFFIIQSKTVIGKFAYAIGANERAARIAGVKTDFTKIAVFIICGVLSALSGIFLAAKLKSGIPTVGEPFNLLGVAAAALGGTSLSGGKGGVIGAILGGALVIVIQNGMNVIAVNAFWQQIVFGVLVILAVYLTVDRSGRGIIIK